jgi:hypothetical protein
VLITGTITLEHVAASGEDKVTVVVEREGKQQEVITADPVDNSVSKFTYSFTYPYETTKPITVKPLPGSLNLIFTPQETAVTRNTVHVPEFRAHQGVYFRGTVAPALENVSITVTGGPLATPVVSQTTQDGAFTVGPFSSKYLADYKLHLERSGYIFTESTSSSRPSLLHFEAKKLSSIKVVAKTDSGVAVPDVHVAISSNKGDRITATTDELGTYLIPLPPAEYFVRVTLKEFEFTPNAKQIKLGVAEEGLFEVVGKRVRYHISGTVQTLSGAESNCKVKAVDTKSSTIHTTACLADGQFAIRDLMPNTNYIVSAEATNGELLSSFPATQKVELKEDDVENITFMTVLGSASMKIPTNTISALIDVDVIPKDVQLPVELSLCSHQSCTPFSETSVFNYRTIVVDDGTYQLTGKIDKSSCSCKSTTTSKTPKYKIVNGTVFTEQGEETSIVAKCTCKYTAGAVDLNISSAASIVVILLAFAAFFFRDSVCFSLLFHLTSYFIYSLFHLFFRCFQTRNPNNCCKRKRNKTYFIMLNR